MSPSIKVFLSLFLLFLVVGVIYSLTHIKGDLVIYLDQQHQPVLDMVFRFFTFLGDGTWFGILIVLFLFIRYSHSLAFTFLGIFQLLLIQGLKRYVFGRLPRPAEYFKDVYQFQEVSGIDIHHFYSFPSGHTATAFGIAAMLILLLRPGKGISAGIFIVAAMVGISRIYLAQHFLEDVLVGAALGIFSAFVTWWVYRRQEIRHPEAGLFHSSLRDKF